MTSLDNFVEKEKTQGSCDECSETDTVLEFESPEGGKENNYQLCRDCLLDAKGRFKNTSPAVILSEYERIVDASLDENQNVIIKTASDFGSTTHIHYTEESEQLQQASPNQVNMYRVLSLTGSSDIYDAESGEWVGSPSPYTAQAAQLISQKNNTRRNQF